MKVDDIVRELRQLALELEAEVAAMPPPLVPDFSDDRIKTESYKAFINSHPEWPAVYARAKAEGKDPLKEWLAIIWKDEICPACNKKGHKHHPQCNCRECF